MHYQNKEKTSHYKKDPFSDRKIKDVRVPKEPIATILDDYRKLSDEGLSYVFFGHSSVLVKADGRTVLFDPVFSKCAGLFNRIGTKRFPGPEIETENLPELDIVAISHNHYDHLDIETLKKLDHKVKKYVVPSGIKKQMVFFGFNKDKIEELGWNDSYIEKNTEMICLPCHHNSVRYLFDKDRTLWCSWCLKTRNHTVYFSGDTAFGKHFEEIRNKIGKIDLVLMECGQYDSAWHDQHMFPEEAVEACRILNGKMNIPIHWGAYCLSFHAWKEPTVRFKRRAEERDISYKIPELYHVYVLEDKSI